MTRRYLLEPCACGSDDFDVTAGRPVRCAACGSIPKELPDATPEPDANVEIEVEPAWA